MNNFAKIVSADKMSALLPHVVALGKDQYSTVRCTFTFYISVCWRNIKKYASSHFKGPMLSNNTAFNQRFNERW